MRIIQPGFLLRYSSFLVLFFWLKRLMRSVSSDVGRVSELRDWFSSAAVAASFFVLKHRYRNFVSVSRQCPVLRAFHWKVNCEWIFFKYSF